MSVQISKLSNGLRVVTEERASIETVSVGAWVDVGARYECDRISGATHCLEHMVFKGTQKRSAHDIAREIEAVGGYMNAYTSREHTTYYARVLKGDVCLAVDVLADILINSQLDPSELAKEKEVILQELGQAQDTPDDIIFDHLQEQAYKGQALGRSILGSSETINGLSAPVLKEFLTNHYTAENMVISAVGNVSHDLLVRMVEDKFAALPVRGPAKQFAPAQFIGGRHIEEKQLEQLHLTLGWQGKAFKDEDYYALQLYSTILGGGMSSRLFQEIREERGLAYSVYSYASSHVDSGIFGIYAGTGPEMAPQLLPVIQQELEDMVDDLEAEDIAVAATQLKAGLLMALEATTSRMEQLGRQMLIFGKPIDVADLVEDIEKVTLEDVKKLGTDILASDNAPCLVALGGGAKQFT